MVRSKRASRGRPIVRAGIDFGTSTCSVAVVEGDEIRRLKLDARDGFNLVSAVFVPNDSRGEPDFADTAHITIGSRALASGRRRGDEGRIFQSPKAVLGTDLSLGAKRLLSNVVRVLFDRLQSRVRNAIGKTVTHAVIGRPVYFSRVTTPNRDDAALGIILEAAREAGIEEVRFVYEPLAAAQSYLAVQPGPQRILVVDVGGGTTDLVLMRPSNPGASMRNVVEAADGDWMGGNDVDRALLDRCVLPLLGSEGLRRDGSKIPKALYRPLLDVYHVVHHGEFYTRSYQARLEAEMARAAAPSRPKLRHLERVRRERLSHYLMHRTERAKTRMTHQRRANIPLDRLEPRLSGTIEAAHLGDACSRLVGHLRAMISAMPDTGSLDCVFVTGGMSACPPVHDLLLTTFPNELAFGDPSGSVVMGLAHYAAGNYAAGNYAAGIWQGN